MSSWTTGSDVIARLCASGELQQVQGGQANGKPWLDKARRTIKTAGFIIDDDPESAYTLAYDAVRFAGTALLAQQGLRPTTRGGHLVVDQALRAQFGERFKAYRTLRIRRNELEYPAYPGELVEPTEVHEALSQATRLIDAAEQVLPYLGFYTARE
jgi:hypothetical protein